LVIGSVPAYNWPKKSAALQLAEAGGFSFLVIASNQPGHLQDYPGIQVEKVLNLHELVDLMLIDSEGEISSSCVETQSLAAT